MMAVRAFHAAGFHTSDAPAAELLEQCVRCGACLPSCPTYRHWGVEPDSPRGRVALIKAVHDGHLPLTSPTFARHIDQCLDCRACETACPMKVPVGRLIEETRAELRVAQGATAHRDALVEWALRALFPFPSRLEAAAAAVAGAQRSGLTAAARRLGLARWLSPPLERMLRYLPLLPSTSARRRLRGGLPARGRARGTVALLHGCVMNVLFADVTVATARVLAHNGWNVAVPRGQGCCGALHAHIGDRETAKALARRNIAAFEASGADAYVVNAAGCGSALREYPLWLRNDPEWSARAEAFARKVWDVQAFLVDRGWQPPTGAFRATVTYQDPCHLIHAQGVRTQPRALLRAVPGLNLVEMPGGDRCCGSAGLYSIAYPDVSDRLLAEKVADVPPDVDVVVTANPGCHLHLLRGLREAGRSTAVMHVMEVLDAAYRSRGKGP